MVIFSDEPFAFDRPVNFSLAFDFLPFRFTFEARSPVL